MKGLLRATGTGVGTGVGTVAGAGRVATDVPPEEANGFTSTFFVGDAAEVSGTADVPMVDESKISEPAIFRGPDVDARPPLEDVANGLNGTDIFDPIFLVCWRLIFQTAFLTCHKKTRSIWYVQD